MPGGCKGHRRGGRSPKGPDEPGADPAVQGGRALDEAILQFLKDAPSDRVGGILVVAVDKNHNAISKMVTDTKLEETLYPIFISILEDLVYELKTGGVTEKKQLNSAWMKLTCRCGEVYTINDGFLLDTDSLLRWLKYHETGPIPVTTARDRIDWEDVDGTANEESAKADGTACDHHSNP